MSSSISSFKNELKVIGLVVLLIGLLEIQRGMEPLRPGAEAVYLNAYPSVADDLASRPGTSMILLGNSLTQLGYDMPLLKSQLIANGHGDLHVEKVALTGSSPIEWYHNYARFFARRGKSPSAIVINMSPSGINDSLPAGYRVGWLAAETQWRDVPEVLFDDLRDVEVDGQYLLSRVSPLYADRWDIRVGVIWKIDHDLWLGMKWVNSGQIPPKVAAGPAPVRTYSLLKRMLEMARKNHTHAILVAMPAREGYDIDPALMEILKAYDVSFLDCRTIPGLTVAGFEDGWHLNPDGAKIFTKFMAGRLPGLAHGHANPL